MATRCREKDIPKEAERLARREGHSFAEFKEIRSLGSDRKKVTFRYTEVIVVAERKGEMWELSVVEQGE